MRIIIFIATFIILKTFIKLLRVNRKFCYFIFYCSLQYVFHPKINIYIYFFYYLLTLSFTACNCLIVDFLLFFYFLTGNILIQYSENVFYINIRKVLSGDRLMEWNGMKMFHKNYSTLYERCFSRIYVNFNFVNKIIKKLKLITLINLEYTIGVVMVDTFFFFFIIF